MWSAAEPLPAAALSGCLAALATFAVLLLAGHAVPRTVHLAGAGPAPAPAPGWTSAAVTPTVRTLAAAPSRRHAGALLLSTAAALAANPAGAQQLLAQTAAESPTVNVWLGSGCFWGRQYDFVELEQKALGRPAAGVTALAGYAGGRRAGPGNLNCYFGGPFGTLYETNGQAEVVQLALDPDAVDTQFRAAIRTYFRQFNRLPTGQMIRQDPQDLGPAYRSVLGLPGGLNSPLMEVVRQENVNNMQLLEGKGDDPDTLNVVWVMDTAAFPFYRAERYHQFHPGLGREQFGTEYLVDLKRVQEGLGRIAPTGCPERTFFSS